MDEGQRPGLSTEALSRELQRSRFKLSTREKILAAAVYMASVTKQRTFEEALLSGKNDGHLRLRCVSEHCRPDETPIPLKVCSLDEVETELGASMVRWLEDLTKTQNDNRPQVHLPSCGTLANTWCSPRSSSTMRIPRISSLGSMTVEVRSSLYSLDRRDTRIESVCKIFQFLVTHHGPVAFSHRAERDFLSQNVFNIGGASDRSDHGFLFVLLLGATRI